MYKITVVTLFLFSFSFSEEFTFVGKLKFLNDSIPTYCGFLHIGTLVQYDSVTILGKDSNVDSLFVVIGCIEMSRKGYEDSSGNIEKFVEGDWHRVTVSSLNIYKVTVFKDNFRKGYYFAKTIDYYKENEKEK